MGNIITYDINEELKENLLEYGVSVNIDRAIPFAETGLKPVHQRIIYGAYTTGALSSKAPIKSAKIVGNVIGELHPHGDTSVYDALVRLAQSWALRYPLIDGQGNFGSRDGDDAAAMRYTEARLSKLAEEGMLQNIKKNVDWRDNYDETIKEPVHLPALFPNILCNPTTGIGYGMASSWMPHNLREVGQAIFDYMDGKEPSIIAPDFPTGGLIINGKDLPDIIKKGRGSVKLRGKYKIEKDSIIFTELPYGVGAEKILEELNVLTEEDESLGISEYTNQSNKNGIRVVIKGKRGTNLETLVNILFAKTSLQSSYSYNQVAIYKGKPVELGLSDIIKIYIAYNLECLKKELSFDLNKAKEREEIVLGLVKALEDIDNIIKMIKESDSAANAKIRLVERYQFTERQVKAILDMKLAKLAKLEKVELNQELEELTSQVKRLTEVLATESLQVGIIRERLTNLIKKFGDDRRTEITNIEVTKGEKQIETVVPENVIVIVTQNGEVRRIPKASFKTQRRAGKGVKTAEIVLETISTNTVDNLLIFTDKGLMYKLLIDDIPSGTNISRGIHLSQLTKMDPTEKVVAVTSLELQNPKNYVIFITRMGLLKKTIIEEYTSIKKSTGAQAIKLKDGDSIANVTFANDEDFIVVTKKGMSIRFETKNIKAIGRVTAGVKTIKLNEGDEVLIGLPVLDDTYLGIITENGFGLKSDLKEWPCQGTNGKGVACYKVTEKSGDVVGAVLLNDNDTLMLTGTPNSICIDAKEVPTLGRASLGNILIKQSKINSVIKM